MQALDKVLAQVGRVVLGKEEQLKLALTCMLANGHLLIEDLPGMGKTTLAHALARVFKLEYRRVQFTSDMLPADILGVSVFDPATQQFSLREGPVFTQLLLADEINRATPKTQSALLEAMEERQVTLDGVTRDLPQPFFVVATQNPVDQAGTFVLPESQLDRFLMRISLGYPAPEVELQLLAGGDLREQVRELQAVINSEGLIKLSRVVGKVRASHELLDYVQRLLDATRSDDRFVPGQVWGCSRRPVPGPSSVGVIMSCPRMYRQCGPLWRSIVSVPGRVAVWPPPPSLCCSPFPLYAVSHADTGADTEPL